MEHTCASPHSGNTILSLRACVWVCCMCVCVLFVCACMRVYVHALVIHGRLQEGMGACTFTVHYRLTCVCVCILIIMLLSMH